MGVGVMPAPITHSTGQPAAKLWPKWVLDIGGGMITMGIAHLGECSKEVLDERHNGSVCEVQRGSVL